ncbi:MAG: hypothetical protein JWN35_1162 [Frankiales bacterium]|jgi:hypothetical protein|nr:hypothetical protein [Frankiales bacterium]
MNRIKLATIALATAGLAAAGGGTAFAAQGSAAATHPAAPTTHPAQPSVTTPDIAGEVTGALDPAGNPSAGATAAHLGAAQQAVVHEAVTPKAQDDPNAESSTESEAPSDGPGGHEDPPGNVDHQFQGVE